MKKLLFCALLCAPFAAVSTSHAADVAAVVAAPQPDANQLAWKVALAINDVETARKLVAAPGFSPTMTLNNWDKTLIYGVLQQQRGEIAALMIERAPAAFFVTGKGELTNLGNSDNLPALRALLARREFDPNRNTDAHKSTALWEALLDDNFESARLLLADARTDVNARNEDGETALAFGSGINSAPTVALMLSDARTDVNVINKDGDTPLHLAAFDYASTESLELLLRDRRVKTRLKNNAGQTPLEGAIAKENLPGVELMLTMGVLASSREMTQIAALRQKQNSPTPTPTQRAWLRILATGDLPAARQQVKLAGFDPLSKLPTPAGDTLLRAALRHDNPALALIMIDAAKSDDYLRADNLLFPLVTRPANVPVLKRFLSLTGFDPNRMTGINNTMPLLNQAVEAGNLEAVRALLAHPKINPNATSQPFEQNALSETIVGKPNSAAIAALLLADPRTNPNQLDVSGNTALYHIAYFGRPDVIKLIAADPRVDVNIAGDRLGAPLDMATAKSLEKVKVLMASGKVVMTPKQREAIERKKADWGLTGVDLFGETK